MKLIIQIPCYNEAGTLGAALGELPREVDGFERVEWLVVDDGSEDDTAEVARANGVDHVVSHPYNMGLARAFMTGLEACIARGADVIVNTDADNQYNAGDIPALVRPVVEGRADYVIGERPISDIEHFSFIKKILQKLGSMAVRVLSKTKVADAPSGFRAISSDAAIQLNVFNEYTYTLETIIQAGHKGLRVVNVPVRVNDDLRPSRLVKSIGNYVKQSLSIMVRGFVIYKPFRFFATIGMILLAAGVLIGVRFLYYFFTGRGGGKLQSLILAAILSLSGIQAFALAFLGDLHATNRSLLESILCEFRRMKKDNTKLKKDNTKLKKSDDTESQE